MRRKSKPQRRPDEQKPDIRRREVDEPAISGEICVSQDLLCVNLAGTARKIVCLSREICLPAGLIRLPLQQCKGTGLQKSAEVIVLDSLPFDACVEGIKEGLNT